MGEVILSVNDLSVDFVIKRRLFGKPDLLSAVSGANLEIQKGEIYGLVGESGCGKTTLANALLGFVPITSGSFTFFGHTIDAHTSAAEWREIRKHMQVVFQDPYSSLDNRFPVWKLIAEPLIIAGETDEKLLMEKAEDLLEKVGLGREDAMRHAFEFSGGQRQRIAIARALITGAEFIICDEPTSALDVSVHSQICNLLLDLQQELGLTYLFISHNLSLIKHITDRMSVMYLGTIMESGDTKKIYGNPACSYTRALTSAILEVKPSEQKERLVLTGEAASPINPDGFCRFRQRCPGVCEICSEKPLSGLHQVEEDHYTSCVKRIAAMQNE